VPAFARRPAELARHRLGVATDPAAAAVTLFGKDGKVIWRAP
jgi:hypothetical protein